MPKFKLKCDYKHAIYTLQDWFTLPRTEGRTRGHLRPGQYVWNVHGKDGKHWPELFYATDSETVFDLLYEHYHPHKLT